MEFEKITEKPSLYDNLEKKVLVRFLKTSTTKIKKLQLP